MRAKLLYLSVSKVIFLHLCWLQNFYVLHKMFSKLSQKQKSYDNIKNVIFLIKFDARFFENKAFFDRSKFVFLTFEFTILIFETPCKCSILITIIAGITNTCIENLWFYIIENPK